MNLFAINGETLNGTPALPLAASAAIAGTVAVDPIATRIVFASASIVGIGGVSATSKLNGAMAADVGGTVSLDGTARHTQAAEAQLDLYSNIVASVYRLVPVTLNINGTITFIVIPASTLGAANIVGNGGLSATATKVQPGSAAIAGTVGVVAAPFVTRRVSASVALNGNLRPEAQKNKAVDAFVDIVGNGNFTMPDVGIVQRQASAYLALANDLTAVATYTQTGYAILGNVLDIVASGDRYHVPFAAMVGTAAFTAAATRTVNPSAAVATTGAVSAKMYQRHAGAVNIVQGNDIIADPTARQLASAVIDPSATISATSTRIRTAAAAINPTVAVKATMKALEFAKAAVTGTVAIDTAPTRLVLATVDGTVTADFTAFAAATYAGQIDITPSAALGLAPVGRYTVSLNIKPTVSFGLKVTRTTYGSWKPKATCTILADGRLNIEAYDPPERTLDRPFIDTEVARPFVDTEMRRAA